MGRVSAGGTELHMRTNTLNLVSPPPPSHLPILDERGRVDGPDGRLGGDEVHSGGQVHPQLSGQGL